MKLVGDALYNAVQRRNAGRQSSTTTMTSLIVGLPARTEPYRRISANPCDDFNDTGATIQRWLQSQQGREEVNPLFGFFASSPISDHPLPLAVVRAQHYVTIPRASGSSKQRHRYRKSSSPMQCYIALSHLMCLYAVA